MNVIKGKRRNSYRTVDFDEKHNGILLIDQRLLPHKLDFVWSKDCRETAQAIRDMTVRGAGAIGATAAFGLAQGLREFQGTNMKAFSRHAIMVYEILKAARPTAVDPVNAMNKIMGAIEKADAVEAAQQIAAETAQAFADEDVAHCRAIGEQGAPLIQEGMRILTHCNAGWLAFVDVGTATAPLYAAQAAGRKFHVFCGETRPRCQGASLTAWELANQEISHEVIVDNAVGHLMQRGEIDLVIVGSDRTLGRTGEVANKIGTYMRAVLAKRHNIPFYVAIPLSTIDWELKSGLEIPIEERDQSEVLGVWGSTGRGAPRYLRTANKGSRARNPGFDVTPAELITGIITPVGIFKPADLWKNRERLQ